MKLENILFVKEVVLTFWLEQFTISNFTADTLNCFKNRLYKHWLGTCNKKQQEAKLSLG